MLTNEDILEIRDSLLPSQGESFDCLAFARAVEVLVQVAPVTEGLGGNTLAADLQEFIYRCASQVPFEHAAWANERGSALLAAVKLLDRCSPAAHIAASAEILELFSSAVGGVGHLARSTVLNVGGEGDRR